MLGKIIILNKINCKKRAIVEYHCDHLPRGIVSTLCSLARQPDNSLCLVATETLVQITLRNPQMSVEMGSIQVNRF